ncbi:hypothetical protein A9Q82_03200 [Cycloclasticus sp. 46_120_T64]|nr:hypothetical protein A9Q82_03200 [Cycloclasticus sp. 46_120_T64]
MQSNKFSWANFSIRFGAALALVFASYNPAGLSYYHWAMLNLTDINPLMALSGLALLIGWVVFIRATLRSLGPIGIGLALAFFGCIVWAIIDWGLVSTDNTPAMTYILQSIICLLLATGMSWSHLRRRMSGQVDADDLDD